MMHVDPSILPESPALLRIAVDGGEPSLALWTDGTLRDLRAAADRRLQSLDRLLALRRAEIQDTIETLRLAASARSRPGCGGDTGAGRARGGLGGGCHLSPEP